jgi:RNA polymerase sigma-70 factor (ECF subfamily)
MSNEPTSDASGDSSFAKTQWSIILKAGRRSSADSRQALQSLCELYWYPLYAYVRRRVGDRSEAEDLTQAFFAELLEKNYVATATPERGKFRAFLITAFKHFLCKEWEKAKAQKRGGGRAPIPLDFQSADHRFSIEPAAGMTPDQLYDQQWALALLDRTMERLQDDFRRAGKELQFGELKQFIVAERTSTLADVAAKLNMTVAATKMAASRLRGRYRELLREEIAQIVADRDEIDDEIRKLFQAMEL